MSDPTRSMKESDTILYELSYDDVVIPRDQYNELLAARDKLNLIDEECDKMTDRRAFLKLVRQLELLVEANHNDTVVMTTHQVLVLLEGIKEIMVDHRWGNEI